MLLTRRRCLWFRLRLIRTLLSLSSLVGLFRFFRNLGSLILQLAEHILDLFLAHLFHHLRHDIFQSIQAFHIVQIDLLLTLVLLLWWRWDVWSCLPHREPLYHAFELFGS